MGNTQMGNTRNELVLEYWELYITEGIMAAIHGDFRKITEIYVPELELSLNIFSNSINVFISKSDRYNMSEDTNNMSGHKPRLLGKINISKKSENAKKLILLANYYKNKKEIENDLKDLFRNSICK